MYRVAAIGPAAWHRILFADRFAGAGGYATVLQVIEQPGGGSVNILSALAKLGVQTTLVSRVGADVEGCRIQEQLESDGIDTHFVETDPSLPTDAAMVVSALATSGPDQATYRIKGARPRHGSFVPIEQMFAHDLVIVDTDDPRLRQLIVDLPMHVAPRTRLLGTLTYLAELPPDHGLDLALRHDYLAGSERQLCYLTATDSLDAAIPRFQDEMILSQTRFAAIYRGTAGCTVFDRDTRVDVSAYDVNIVDTTGAADAFAAGVAVGILERRELVDVGRLANALGALTTRAAGARAALPDRDEVDQLLEQQRETGTR